MPSLLPHCLSDPTSLSLFSEPGVPRSAPAAVPGAGRAALCAPAPGLPTVVSRPRLEVAQYCGSRPMIDHYDSPFNDHELLITFVSSAVLKVL